MRKSFGRMLAAGLAAAVVVCFATAAGAEDRAEVAVNPDAGAAVGVALMLIMAAAAVLLPILLVVIVWRWIFKPIVRELAGIRQQLQAISSRMPAGLSEEVNQVAQQIYQAGLARGDRGGVPEAVRRQG